MAGDWIKMRSDLHTHPKIVRMASALKADRLRIVGGLHSAWCLFDVHSVDGFLDGYSPETLDDMIGFPGFSRAMMAVGWLEVDGENLVMPRFDEHNGQSAKRRAQDAARKRNVRKMSASQTDKMTTREEKRREDLKDKPHSNARAKDSPPGDPPKEPPPFPMNGNNFGKFQMFKCWIPGQDFVQSAALWGRPIGVGYSPPELAEFVTFWIAEGKVFQQAQWEQKFAQSIVKRRAIESKSGGSNGQIQQSAATGGRAVEKIRAAIAAEREREGISPLGNDGGNVFGSLGGEERGDAVIDLESGDWRSE
ncbi:DnaT-like ssDNA-binding domain-containing protein [Serratia liquefaciens]|uniref:DnaT-like ssDNA-binding domain-containing protein n=1 Tax=Serratia liquefaciens TaxID=614 RepID=UPI001F5C2D67|nr:DnaT-like ssDNA-binding domain-containing protein [Serratia liquefaciens]